MINGIDCIDQRTPKKLIKNLKIHLFSFICSRFSIPSEIRIWWQWFVSSRIDNLSSRSFLPLGHSVFLLVHTPFIIDRLYDFKWKKFKCWHVSQNVFIETQNLVRISQRQKFEDKVQMKYNLFFFFLLFQFFQFELPPTPTLLVVRHACAN